MENQVVKYDVEDATISKMENEFLPLKVSGLDDKAGLAAVHEARMTVKNLRVSVEKRRKELKASALEWGRKVDSEAKRIFDRLEPIESHLTKEEEKVKQELERIRAEKERQLQEAAQAKCDAMARVGVPLAYARALNLSDDEFSAMLSEATAAYEAEQARIAEERRREQERAEEARKAREHEEARLAVERAEIERLKAQEEAMRIEAEALMKAEREKLEAERRDIENAKREAERQAELERAKKEAAEKAEREAKERADREAREKIEAEQRAKDEAERQERLRPDREKLAAFAASILQIRQPELLSEAAGAVLAEAIKKMNRISKWIMDSINLL